MKADRKSTTGAIWPDNVYGKEQTLNEEGDCSKLPPD